MKAKWFIYIINSETARETEQLCVDQTDVIKPSIREDFLLIKSSAANT